MPRTKRPVKKQEKSTKDDEGLKKFLKIVADQKSRIDMRAQMENRNLELAFKILHGSISDADLQKTIGQLKTELHLKEVISSQTTRHSNRSASHDDGYLTENSSQGSGDRGYKKTTGSTLAPPTLCRSTGRRSRSADPRRAPTLASTHKPSQSRRRSKSVYKTPAYNKMSANCYPVITPKVAPQTPLMVLRQPRHGEMVVSMSGSPVMVPSYNTMQQDDKANCNILLQDGTMLSLQPKQLRQSNAFIPFSLMDSNCLSQLKTLKDNLDKLVTMGERQARS